MIRNYFGSMRGKSHIKNNIVGQDYSLTVVINDQLTIAAIADGVGQARLAEVGSEAAVKTAIDYCQKVLKKVKIYKLSSDVILSVIKNAFATAYNRIIDISLKEGNPLYDYDTTLDMVAYFNSKVIYGHSGDGGIIGLKLDGTYDLITKPQNGKDGISVIPLRFNNFWEFGIAKYNYASVMLLTDGVYNAVTYTKYNDPNRYVFVSLAEALANLAPMEFNSKELENHGYKMLAFLFNDSIITDDITVSVIYDENIKPNRALEEYYAVPNWKEINREKREAIFGKKVIKEESDNIVQKPIMVNSMADITLTSPMKFKFNGRTVKMKRFR